jgi:oligopeptide transport system ATP-binding protein
MALLELSDLRTWFHTREGVVRAVDGVSLAIGAGEMLGVVGESGSGKSVTFYSLLGLVPSPPGRIESGRALFEGRDLLQMPPRELRDLRGRRIAMVFQDPMTALNPYMTVAAQVAEPLTVHEGLSGGAARVRVLEALRAVGIQDAERRMDLYPHAISGGMRQRVMIAMALTTSPALLIADEPTTALDVTVQAQILDLIAGLQRDRGMAVALITHDLGVVARACDRVAVMYAGRVVESATTEALFDRPRHPYTEALMHSLPSTADAGAPLRAIPGMPPDLLGERSGCSFAPRCAHAADRCRTAACALVETAPGHATACVRAQAGEW